jgi:hypothetical protein
LVSRPSSGSGALDEADVGAVLADGGDRARRVGHVDLRVDAGELGAEGGEPGRQQRLADGVAGGDPQRPGGAVAGDGLLGERQRVEGAPRLRVERHALVGRPHAVAAADQEADGKAALECLDPLRGRRLGQVERLRGALHAARLDRGEEGGELAGGQGIGHTCIPARNCRWACVGDDHRTPSLTNSGEVRSGVR